MTDEQRTELAVSMMNILRRTAVPYSLYSILADEDIRSSAISLIRNAVQQMGYEMSVWVYLNHTLSTFILYMTYRCLNLLLNVNASINIVFICISYKWIKNISIYILLFQCDFIIFCITLLGELVNIVISVDNTLRTDFIYQENKIKCHWKLNDSNELLQSEKKTKFMYYILFVQFYKYMFFSYLYIHTHIHNVTPLRLHYWGSRHKLYKYQIYLSVFYILNTQVIIHILLILLFYT